MSPISPVRRYLSTLGKADVGTPPTTSPSSMTKVAGIPSVSRSCMPHCHPSLCISPPFSFSLFLHEAFGRLPSKQCPAIVSLLGCKPNSNDGNSASHDSPRPVISWQKKMRRWPCYPLVQCSSVSLQWVLTHSGIAQNIILHEVHEVFIQERLQGVEVRVPVLPVRLLISVWITLLCLGVYGIQLATLQIETATDRQLVTMPSYQRVSQDVQSVGPAAPSAGTVQKPYREHEVVYKGPASQVSAHGLDMFLT
ncbi:hypothetical protein PG987_010316 [Apiospora arundinis]